MRPGQQNKRGRGRSGSAGGSGNNNSNNNNNNRKGQNPLSRSYDSSGPDVKIRGTAQHVAEKYMNLARDAQSSGDRVMAENYLQHAEHYNRIIFTAQAQMQERFQQNDRDQQRDGNDGNDQNNDSDNDDNNDDDDMESGQSTNQSYEDQRFNGQNERQSDRQSDRQNNGQQERSGNAQEARQSDRQAERQPDRQPDRQAERQPERPRRVPRERHAPAEQDVAAKPVFDSNSPQPVIDGVPAEVAIEQDNPGAAGAARAPVRRRGRPRRVRTDEGDQGGSESGSSDATPSTEVAPAD